MSLAVAVALLVSLVASAAATRASPRWTPRPGTTWQWQLTEPVDLRVPAKVYDIDGFDNSAAVVRRLHARGRKVICYIDAGAYESYRPDASRFPPSVLGKADRPWAGERWLDIRRLDVLGPIMRARIHMCSAKGFDGVELDEIDGWSNDTGFPLTAADQLRYNRFLAREVHKAGMSAGLKNDVEQVRALLPSFDFAIDEQCYQYRECDALRPFVAAGKAVFHTEYSPRSEALLPGGHEARALVDEEAPRPRRVADLLRRPARARARCEAPGGWRGSSSDSPVRIQPVLGRVVLRAGRSPVGAARFAIGAGRDARVAVALTKQGRQLLSAGPVRASCSPRPATAPPSRPTTGCLSCCGRPRRATST